MIGKMEQVAFGETKKLTAVVDEDFEDIYACFGHFADELDAELSTDVLVIKDVEMPGLCSTERTCSKTHCSFAPNLCFDF